MGIFIETVPIDQWPGKLRTWREPSRFKTNYARTVDLLERELEFLGAKDVVIQLALSRSDIRLDGRPRADARPSHPGVILSFNCKRGALSYPCDKYRDWHDNVRAIALSLEALRSVDRHGVTQNGEQYKGWVRLDNAPTASVAREILRQVAGIVNGESIADADLIRAAWKKSHPDSGGDASIFKEVEKARKVLEQKVT